jgi:hypothetical protein
VYSGAERAFVRARTENADVSFAAEKNNALIQHAKTANFLCSAVCKAKLKFDFQKHPYIYLEKSGAEGNFVKPYIGGNNFRALRPDIYTSLQSFSAR